jgi:formylglycine-generating enzyme required for sulfatase activity
MATGVIYRLPLEEEWEWAAGGGKRKYPWGDSAPQNAHANFNGVMQGLTPVHAFPEGATPDGLMDMAGNVWEWTATWLDEKKEQRLVRGGAGFNDEVALRCVSRDGIAQKFSRFIGFRVARIVPD